jgi:hypothetical protein
VGEDLVDERAGLSAEEWRQLEDDLVSKAATAVRRGPRALARMAVLNAATALAIRLLVTWKRGEATTGRERERAARALLRIGSRLGESPLRLEAMLGSVMAAWAATALGDQQALARVQERRRRIEEEMDAEPTALPFWSWPLEDIEASPGPLR